VWIAWGRVALAAVVLLPLARKRGALRGLDRHIAAIFTFALAEVIVPFFLIAIGEQWISSSLTVILIATIPLLVVLLAPWFVPSERPGPKRLVGLGLGLIGVIALLGIDIAGRPLEALGAACVLTSAVGYAVGPLVTQRCFVGSTRWARGGQRRPGHCGICPSCCFARAIALSNHEKALSHPTTGKAQIAFPQSQPE